MTLLDKVKNLLVPKSDQCCPVDHQDLPDNFDDYSEVDSTLVDSKEGAPE